MIPIKLTFQGLYSYQEKQFIDFKKLTDARLFGIFGSVGSGKSSILEAITFALYGKTDRLNLSGDNRNYNMLNLKSNTLGIEFEFLAGENHYLSTVLAKRNSKRFDDVKKPERALYLKKGEEWVPQPLESIEEIIGLSYENFKRTIIIPQGKFQEFLQLGDTERTKMMKELFKLEKFELSFKVGYLEKENDKVLENLKGQLSEIGIVDEGQIEALKTQLHETLKSIEVKGGELKEAEKQLQALKKIKELFENRQQQEALLKQLTDKKTYYQELLTKVERIEECRTAFKPAFDEHNKISAQLKHVTDGLGTEKIKLVKCTQQLEGVGKKLEELLPRFNAREQLKEKAKELHTVQEIIKAKVEAITY
jgi:exonuclease SbcC